jgi:hypothetical protein
MLFAMNDSRQIPCDANDADRLEPAVRRLNPKSLR